MKTLLLTTVLCGALFAAAPAEAGGYHRHHGHHHGWHGHRHHRWHGHRRHHHHHYRPGCYDYPSVYSRVYHYGYYPSSSFFFHGRNFGFGFGY